MRLIIMFNITERTVLDEIFIWFYLIACCEKVSIKLLQMSKINFNQSIDCYNHY